MDLNPIAARSAFEKLVANAAVVREKLWGDHAYTVMVGCATCGRSAGALAVAESFRRASGKIDAVLNVLEVGCMGHCYAEPMAVIKRPDYPPMVYHHLNPIMAKNLVERFLVEGDPLLEFFLGATENNDMLPTMMDLPRYGKEVRKLLKKCGMYDPADVMQSIALGGYAGLIEAIEMGPVRIIQVVKESGLRGMGGAGFEAWRKFETCRAQAEEERYIICNADEGDPGAFMDRTLLESDPHAVIEGLLIGALAISSNRGLIYVRAEYPLAVEMLHRAMDAARKAGLLGENILGSGFRFDVEVFEGAGAFVCGEETALIASIEGRRGEPRIRPPFTAQHGLYGKPTVLNNVKSLASLGSILSEGADVFANIGTPKSKGTGLFALAGKIVNPGLVEVPMGTTLRELVFAIGGGIPAGKKFKAVQIGGPSGGCLPEEYLDTSIDFDELKRAGAMMGSGGLVVLDEDNCMVDTAKFFLEFTQEESCGKCTFCRIGTRHMLDLLEKITQGNAGISDLDRLKELAEDVQRGSLCNLGKTAPNPVLTTLRFFEAEYEAHILEKRCPSKVCNALSAYFILPEKCARGCDACVGSCPPEAIYTTRKRIKAIDQSLCIKCDSCVGACPKEYNAVIKISPVDKLPPAEPRPEDRKGV